MTRRQLHGEDRPGQNEQRRSDHGRHECATSQDRRRSRGNAYNIIVTLVVYVHDDIYFLLKRHSFGSNGDMTSACISLQACAVMALERVPADIRRDGGVARMTDPQVNSHHWHTYN